MTLSSNSHALRPGLFTYFHAAGGTEPYVYTVRPGGVSGTIDASSGLYTAPASGRGIDTIRATDALGAFEELTIVVGTPLEIFCDVIAQELELESDQVFLWDQKFTVPKDSRLYVAVSVLAVKPFGNTCRLDDDGEVVQSANFQAQLGLDIYSRSTDALTRKEEVVLALVSLYSQAQQEVNSFYIAPLSSGFVNLSVLDGAAIPYRFNIQVAIQYSVYKAGAGETYDDFDSVEVTTEP